jgi:hypothetical protein
VSAEQYRQSVADQGMPVQAIHFIVALIIAVSPIA